MRIYLDTDFKCHALSDGTMTAVEADFFDGKCPEFIEGYRYIPEGEVWTRADGKLFKGEMLCPWKPYSSLVYAQALYEIEIREAALAELGVTADD